MSILSTILEHNQQFVTSKAYDELSTDKYPTREVAILTCMDARIVELLPKALGIKNGDINLIKNAGALVSHPWGATARSLLLAALDFNVKEIFIIGHTDCGMRGCEPSHILEKAITRGVAKETINTLRHAGINLDSWLSGFDSVADSVRFTVKNVKNHPLMPKDVVVHGLVIHPATGRLHIVVDGYTNTFNRDVAALLDDY